MSVLDRVYFGIILTLTILGIWLIIENNNLRNQLQVVPKIIVIPIDPIPDSGFGRKTPLPPTKINYEERRIS